MLSVSLFAGCAESRQGNENTTTPATSPVAEINSATAGGKEVKVVATNTVLCDLTKQVAGDTVDLKCLIKPGAG